MKFKLFIVYLSSVMLSVFASGSAEPFHKTADYIDMEKFSGDWYVIALIPTVFEKKAVNGIENYSIDDKGIIRVKYDFNIGSTDGRRKTMYQKGWIIDETTKAEWKVQPLWPLKLPYYVLEVNPDYTLTAIGTNNYKYLWIMSREPNPKDSDIAAIIERMVTRGYQREAIIYMQQDWGN